MQINFQQACVQAATFNLTIDQWQLSNCQRWGVFCAEGDIGSLLGNLLTGERVCDSGQLCGSLGHVAQVSLSEQQKLLEQELADDDSDFLDEMDPGHTVLELLLAVDGDQQTASQLMASLDLVHLKDCGFKLLSTGETRRLMLARALASHPDFLILQEPFAGLDAAHRQALAGYLEGLIESLPMMVILSREADMPTWVDNIALFHQGCLVELLPKQDWDNHPLITHLKAQSKQESEAILALVRHHRHQPQLESPIFRINQGRVAYQNKTIFSGLDWQIEPGEHWQIRGPNGSGKSTLLGLITGDHPQCYSNDIHIFGRKRGSGETIWDIKQQMGMVSSALHLQYRVSCNALEVILSGFYDSIGLYQRPTHQQVKTAKEWLALLHLTPYAKLGFRQLEYGQQRLLLIARALVKQPALLILDEPYQGLDYLGRRLVKNALEFIAQENLSQLLYVSHYQEDNLPSISNTLELVKGANQAGYQAKISRSH